MASLPNRSISSKGSHSQNIDENWQSLTISETDKFFANEVLGAHNKYRERHGSPPMIINETMCKWSLSYAKYLAENEIMVHRENNPYGQNIFYSWSSNPNDEVTGCACVRHWYDEVREYECYGMEPVLENISRVGHFTQVVWKDTKEIGVGRAKSKQGAWYVVVDYDPKGNWINEFGANVLPPKDMVRSTTSLEQAAAASKVSDDKSQKSTAPDFQKRTAAKLIKHSFIPKTPNLLKSPTMKEVMVRGGAIKEDTQKQSRADDLAKKTKTTDDLVRGGEQASAKKGQHEKTMKDGKEGKLASTRSGDTFVKKSEDSSLNAKKEVEGSLKSVNAFMKMMDSNRGGSESKKDAYNYGVKTSWSLDKDNAKKEKEGQLSRGGKEAKKGEEAANKKTSSASFGKDSAKKGKDTDPSRGGKEAKKGEDAAKKTSNLSFGKDSAKKGKDTDPSRGGKEAKKGEDAAKKTSNLSFGKDSDKKGKDSDPTRGGKEAKKGEDAVKKTSNLSFGKDSATKGKYTDPSRGGKEAKKGEDAAKKTSNLSFGKDSDKKGKDSDPSRGGKESKKCGDAPLKISHLSFDKDSDKKGKDSDLSRGGKEAKKGEDAAKKTSNLSFGKDSDKKAKDSDPSRGGKEAKKGEDAAKKTSKLSFGKDSNKKGKDSDPSRGGKEAKKGEDATKKTSKLSFGKDSDKKGKDTDSKRGGKEAIKKYEDTRKTFSDSEKGSVKKDADAKRGGKEVPKKGYDAMKNIGLLGLNRDSEMNKKSGSLNLDSEKHSAKKETELKRGGKDSKKCQETRSNSTSLNSAKSIEMDSKKSGKYGMSDIGQQRGGTQTTKRRSCVETLNLDEYVQKKSSSTAQKVGKENTKSGSGSIPFQRGGADVKKGDDESQRPDSAHEKVTLTIPPVRSGKETRVVGSQDQASPKGADSASKSPVSKAKGAGQSKREATEKKKETAASRGGQEASKQTENVSKIAQNKASGKKKTSDLTSQLTMEKNATKKDSISEAQRGGKEVITKKGESAKKQGSESKAIGPLMKWTDFVASKGSEQKESERGGNETLAQVMGTSDFAEEKKRTEGKDTEPGSKVNVGESLSKQFEEVKRTVSIKRKIGKKTPPQNRDFRNDPSSDPSRNSEPERGGVDVDDTKKTGTSEESKAVKTINSARGSEQKESERGGNETLAQVMGTSNFAEEKKRTEGKDTEPGSKGNVGESLSKQFEEVKRTVSIKRKIGKKTPPQNRDFRNDPSSDPSRNSEPERGGVDVDDTKKTGTSEESKAVKTINSARGGETEWSF
ncbi:unnamed protein product [Cyprideis torosa]|uniref:Uncharacterized protein n=1 Tax=Cyprideis torosa TaxID=163714 RepID=A0A7R8WB12_9CRUS|nr:unnamed protein product [Cyprideis torosa]CAG0891717.1 unnamed protein product [Cyprideis torosa]